MSRVFSLAKPLSLATLGILGIFATPAAPSRQAAPVVAPVTHTYGAFWQVGNGYTSTLVLKNNAPANALLAQVTLFGSSGQPAGVSQISIAANGVIRTDLSTLSGPQGGSGGMMLQFTGGDAQFAGKIVITNTQRGATTELPLEGGYRYDTENALYAPWWLPDTGTNGRITLFNASAQSLIVSPSLLVKGSEQIGNKITLPPFATVQLRLSDLPGANHEVSGAVVLRYFGSPHALHPALLLENKSTGFWLASEFNAKHAQLNNQVTMAQFPDVRFGNASFDDQKGSAVETYALLTNGTASPLSPRVMVYYGDHGRAAKAELPVSPLAPLETRLVDLSQAVSGGLIPPSTSDAGLSAAYSGLPGDLALNIFSVGKSNNLIFKVSGTILPGSVLDASYWNSATNVCLLPRLQNDSSMVATGQVTINYPTPFGVGSYVLPALSVTGGKSRVLALKQDLQTGIPDQSGTVVPGGTTSGMLALAAVNGIGNGLSGPLAGSGAECKTAETCALPTATPSASTSLTSGLHLVAPPSCGAPPPVITSISPTGAPFDTNNTVTINGDNLDDPAITVSATGGITASIQSASSTQIVATFDTSGETTVGAQDIFLISDFGHSNSEPFEVGDPTPSIDNISPAVWPAGTVTPVTITGSGFGTNPSVSIDDPSITYSITKATDTGLPHGASISANITVPGPTPAENPTVSITSRGYNGSGFVHSTSGQSPSSPTFTVVVTPIAAPKPAIFFNGSDITTTATTPAVVVGQQILLKGCINASGNTCQNPPLPISSQVWGVPGGTVVAGYTNAAGNGPPDTTGGQTTQLLVFTNPTITYYWVKGGNPLSETYSYCMVNGQCSSTVTAKFNVKGFASGAPFTAPATAGAVKVYNKGANGYWLECGNANGTVCIQFTATAAPPAGGSANASFQWVQIINSSTAQYRTTPTSPNSLCLGSGVLCPALDNVYPYPTLAGQPNTTNDSPGIQLAYNGVTGFGEAGQTFKAQMYMMWDPALMAYGQSGSCTPAFSRQNANGTLTATASTCTGSIPIPVGYVIWGFGGDAINPSDQVISTSWILSCGGPNPANPSVVNSSTWPLWTRSTSNHQ